MLKIYDRKGAFTLVEISIVIVIIGLVLGGVLVGRDLIAAAEQRRFIAQIEQYKTAVHTFRSKYNGIPGDLPNGTSFNFAGNGNGDGCVILCPSGLGISDYTISEFSAPISYNEMALFWNMLSGAGLINGRFDGDIGFVATDTISRTIPATTLNPKIGLIAYRGVVSINSSSAVHQSKHFFSMTVNDGNILWFDRTGYAGTSGVSVLVAQNIDQKIDDGFPGSGTVVVGASADAFFDQTAIDGSADITGATLGSEYCAYLPASSSRWLYNLTSKQRNCFMRFEGGF